MSARKQIDWEAVEIQYRAGIRSLKDIGAEFGVSDAGILKRAKRDGWTRDLRAKIQAKADAKVSASLVSDEVSARTKVAESQVIEAEATVQARIRLTHRTDIARSRKLAMSLLAELEHQTEHGELFEQIEQALNEQFADGGKPLSESALARVNEGYRRAMSLANRTGTMKALSDTLKTLVALEREAYSITPGLGDPDNKAPSGLNHFYGDSGE